MKIAVEIVSAQGVPEGSNLKISTEGKQDPLRVVNATNGVCIYVAFDKLVWLGWSYKHHYYSVAEKALVWEHCLVVVVGVCVWKGEGGFYDLIFKTPSLPPPVMCCVSHVTSDISCVTCPMLHFICLMSHKIKDKRNEIQRRRKKKKRKKVVKLVGGGSVINGATLFSLLVMIEFKMCVQVQN